MKSFILTLLTCVVLAGCSTTGGIYDSKDEKNNQFSVGNTLLTILGVAAAAAIAAGGGSGGGGTGGNSFAPTDYDWAWDQYYNQYRQLVWSCRGKQTGQFAELSKCQYKVQNDLTWPAK
jgi:hypothetical protein